jgi:threonine dehydratase
VLRMESGSGWEQIAFKLDTLQPTGTFKVRGAFNRLLAESTPPERVVAASGGNFAKAIAHAARRLGSAADLFVPDTSPREKLDALAAYGATIHVIPGMYPDALEASIEFAGKTGAVFAHAYDQPEVVAGAGTVAMEVEAQIPDVDTVFIAVGGGGLIAGVSSWFRSRVKVVGVETEGTPTLHEAMRHGQPVEVELSGIAISSLGARTIGTIAWEAARQWVADSLLVSDEAVVAAQRWLWEELRIVAEPGSAAAIAPLVTGDYRPAPNERIVVVVCGANAAAPG